MIMKILAESSDKIRKSSLCSGKTEKKRLTPEFSGFRRCWSEISFFGEMIVVRCSANIYSIRNFLKVPKWSVWKIYPGCELPQNQFISKSGIPGPLADFTIHLLDIWENFRLFRFFGPFLEFFKTFFRHRRCRPMKFVHPAPIQNWSATGLIFSSKNSTLKWLIRIMSEDSARIFIIMKWWNLIWN